MSSDTLFKAIARRDPSKRQIKPVNTDHLALLDDIDDDSDSEYICEEIEDDDGDGDDDDEESDSACSDDEASNSEESSVHSSSTQDSEVQITSQSLNFKSKSDSPNATKNGEIKCLPESMSTEPATGHALANSTGVKTKDVDIMICMLCLGDSVDLNDELIECDGCGIVVHEDCYKVVDSIFLSSGASSSSTDAWFCEPCLAGVTSPICELCPVLDGVFKRTDNNRWVHLLCALYTPGVAFNDPDNLMEVTLTELPQRQWSLHECSLCEDRFFAWTGVCISCDAGLCRTFFHVTCAQKHGLLSEPTVDETSADPFFAHCRQHTDKTVARHRRRNFLTAMLRLRKWRSNKQVPVNNSEEKRLPCYSGVGQVFTTDMRIQRKFEHYRDLYTDLIKHRDKPYVPLVKTPLFLETSPVAMRLFVSKAKALSLPIEFSNHASNVDSSKGPTPSYPVFTPDFVSYFLERERKIMEISKHISTLQNTQRELQIADASASHSYNSITAELEKLVTQRGGLFVKFSHIVNTLRNLIPGLKLSCELENVLSEHLRPVETSALDVSSSDPLDSSRSVKFGSSAVIAASKRKRPFSPSSKVRKVSKSETSDQNTTASKDTVASHLDNCSGVKFEPESVILECTVCHGLQDQHLITSCDACGKAFHLACLDPPLLRMPKRSKIYSWQCSFCTKDVSMIPGTDTIDVNAPRQLRRSGGIPSNKTPSVKLEVTKASIPKDSSICKSEVDPNLQMPVSSNPTISAEDKSRVTSRSAASRHKKSRSSVGAKSSLASPVSKGGKRKSSGVLKTSLSSKCKSLLSNRRTQRRKLAPEIPLENDFLDKIDSKVTSSPSVVMTQVCSADFDQFKFTEDEEPMDSESNKKIKCESDEELASLRASKVIKFVQIRDHESSGEIEDAEQIAPLQQRYVICRGSSPQPKRSSTGKFKLKFKKL
ncbi:unnamed protein product [Trichobilharzia szidati]|nr:unnamed protein product [Trichobilharzia szidati]